VQRHFFQKRKLGNLELHVKLAFSDEMKPMTNAPPLIFDRNRKKMQRNRAAMQFEQADFLFDAVITQLNERLLDIKKEFKSILQLGAHDGRMRDHLKRFNPDQLITTDHADGFVSKAQKHAFPNEKIMCVDEEILPFSANEFDLVIAPLTLHWVNDLPGCLTQIRRVLKPDGLFLGAVFGQNTLEALRTSFLQVEMDELQGVRPHLSPSLDIKEFGALMQRAGFALPVLDKEEISVRYNHLFDLMKDLRNMGQNSALMQDWKGFSSRKIFMDVAEDYAAKSPDAENIEAEFELIYFSGWTPHASQQKPSKRGSATHSFDEALNTKSSLSKLTQQRQ
jgi:NADH dehydrogenase [ubiquinone] 1 alpha subcomplex assembly factor 5